MIVFYTCFHSFAFRALVRAAYCWLSVQFSISLPFMYFMPQINLI